MTRKSKPFLAFADLGLWWAGTVPTIAGVSELSSSSELGVGASIITLGVFFPVLLNCVTCGISKYQIYCEVDNEPRDFIFLKENILIC